VIKEADRRHKLTKERKLYAERIKGEPHGIVDTVLRASRAMGPLGYFMMKLDSQNDGEQTFKAVMGKETATLTKHTAGPVNNAASDAGNAASFALRIGRRNAMAPLNAALLIDDDTAQDDEKTRFHAVRALRHLSRDVRNHQEMVKNGCVSLLLYALARNNKAVPEMDVELVKTLHKLVEPQVRQNSERELTVWEMEADNQRERLQSSIIRHVKDGAGVEVLCKSLIQARKSEVERVVVGKPGGRSTDLREALDGQRRNLCTERMKMYVVYVLKHFADIQASDIANEKRLRSHLLGALLPYTHTEDAQEVLIKVGVRGLDDLRKGGNMKKNESMLDALKVVLDQNEKQHAAVMEPHRLGRTTSAIQASSRTVVLEKQLYRKLKAERSMTRSRVILYNDHGGGVLEYHDMPYEGVKGLWHRAKSNDAPSGQIPVADIRKVYPDTKDPCRFTLVFHGKTLINETDSFELQSEDAAEWVLWKQNIEDLQRKASKPVKTMDARDKNYSRELFEAVFGLVMMQFRMTGDQQAIEAWAKCNQKGSGDEAPCPAYIHGAVFPPNRRCTRCGQPGETLSLLASEQNVYGLSLHALVLKELDWTAVDGLIGCNWPGSAWMSLNMKTLDEKNCDDISNSIVETDCIDWVVTSQEFHVAAFRDGFNLQTGVIPYSPDPTIAPEEDMVSYRNVHAMRCYRDRDRDGDDVDVDAEELDENTEVHSEDLVFLAGMLVLNVKRNLRRQGLVHRCVRGLDLAYNDIFVSCNQERQPTRNAIVPEHGGENGIKALCKALTHPIPLEWLDMHHNFESCNPTNSMEELAKVFEVQSAAKRPRLRHLRLASDEWIPIEDFQDLSQTGIDLSRKGYGKAEAVIIGSLLKHLFLSDKELSRTVAVAGQPQVQNTTLQLLDLSHNHWDREPCPLTPDKGVYRVNGDGPLGGGRDWWAGEGNAFGNVLESSIRGLPAVGTRLEREHSGHKKLAIGLNVWSRRVRHIIVYRLSLSHADVTDESLGQISRQNGQIENLEGSFTDALLPIVAAKHAIPIQAVDLSHNQITEQGIAMLFHYRAADRKKGFVGSPKNGCFSEGVPALLQMNMESKFSIDLSGNNIGDIGLFWILRALSHVPRHRQREDNLVHDADSYRLVEHRQWLQEKRMADEKGGVPIDGSSIRVVSLPDTSDDQPGRVALLDKHFQVRVILDGNASLIQSIFSIISNRFDPDHSSWGNPSLEQYWPERQDEIDEFPERLWLRNAAMDILSKLPAVSVRNRESIFDFTPPKRVVANGAWYKTIRDKVDESKAEGSIEPPLIKAALATIDEAALAEVPEKYQFMTRASVTQSVCNLLSELAQYPGGSIARLGHAVDRLQNVLDYYRRPEIDHDVAAELIGCALRAIGRNLGVEMRGGGTFVPKNELWACMQLQSDLLHKSMVGKQGGMLRSIVGTMKSIKLTAYQSLDGKEEPGVLRDTSEGPILDVLQSLEASAVKVKDGFLNAGRGLFRTSSSKVAPSPTTGEPEGAFDFNENEGALAPRTKGKVGLVLRGGLVALWALSKPLKGDNSCAMPLSPSRRQTQDIAKSAVIAALRPAFQVYTAGQKYDNEGDTTLKNVTVTVVCNSLWHFPEDWELQRAGLGCMAEILVDLGKHAHDKSGRYVAAIDYQSGNQLPGIVARALQNAANSAHSNSSLNYQFRLVAIPALAVARQFVEGEVDVGIFDEIIGQIYTAEEYRDQKQKVILNEATRVLTELVPALDAEQWWELGIDVATEACALLGTLIDLGDRMAEAGTLVCEDCSGGEDFSPRSPGSATRTKCPQCQGEKDKRDVVRSFILRTHSPGNGQGRHSQELPAGQWRCKPIGLALIASLKGALAKLQDTEGVLGGDRLLRIFRLYDQIYGLMHRLARERPLCDAMLDGHHTGHPSSERVDCFLPVEVMSSLYTYSLHLKDGDKYSKSRPSGQWEFYHELREWCVFDDATAEQIEAAYQKRVFKIELRVSRKGKIRAYTINLRKMIQANPLTRTLRQIRRVHLEGTIEQPLDGAWDLKREWGTGRAVGHQSYLDDMREKGGLLLHRLCACTHLTADMKFMKEHVKNAMMEPRPYTVLKESAQKQEDLIRGEELKAVANEMVMLFCERNLDGGAVHDCAAKHMKDDTMLRLDTLRNDDPVFTMKGAKGFLEYRRMFLMELGEEAGEGFVETYTVRESREDPSFDGVVSVKWEFTDQSLTRYVTDTFHFDQSRVIYRMSREFRLSPDEGRAVQSLISSDNLEFDTGWIDIRMPREQRSGWEQLVKTISAVKGSKFQDEIQRLTVVSHLVAAVGCLRGVDHTHPHAAKELASVQARQLVQGVLNWGTGKDLVGIADKTNKKGRSGLDGRKNEAIQRIMETLARLMIGAVGSNGVDTSSGDKGDDADKADKEAIGGMISLMKLGIAELEESSVVVLGTMADDHTRHANLLEMNALGEVVAVMKKHLKRGKATIPVTMAFRGTYMIWKLSDATTRRRSKAEIEAFKAKALSLKSQELCSHCAEHGWASRKPDSWQYYEGCTMEYSMRIVLSCLVAHPNNPSVQRSGLLALGEVLQTFSVTHGSVPLKFALIDGSEQRGLFSVVKDCIDRARSQGAGGYDFQQQLQVIAAAFYALGRLLENPLERQSFGVNHVRYYGLRNGLDRVNENSTDDEVSKACDRAFGWARECGGTIDEAAVVAGEVKYRALTMRSAGKDVRHGAVTHAVKVSEAVKVCRSYAKVTLKAPATLASHMTWLTRKYTPEQCGEQAAEAVKTGPKGHGVTPSDEVDFHRSMQIEVAQAYQRRADKTHAQQETIEYVTECMNAWSKAKYSEVFGEDVVMVQLNGFRVLNRYLCTDMCHPKVIALQTCSDTGHMHDPAQAQRVPMWTKEGRCRLIDLVTQVIKAYGKHETLGFAIICKGCEVLSQLVSPMRSHTRWRYWHLAHKPKKSDEWSHDSEEVNMLRRRLWDAIQRDRFLFYCMQVALDPDAADLSSFTPRDSPEGPASPEQKANREFGARQQSKNRSRQSERMATMIEDRVALVTAASNIICFLAGKKEICRELCEFEPAFARLMVDSMMKVWAWDWSKAHLPTSNHAHTLGTVEKRYQWSLSKREHYGSGSESEEWGGTTMTPAARKALTEKVVYAAALQSRSTEQNTWPVDHLATWTCETTVIANTLEFLYRHLPVVLEKGGMGVEAVKALEDMGKNVPGPPKPTLTTQDKIRLKNSEEEEKANAVPSRLANAQRQLKLSQEAGSPEDDIDHWRTQVAELEQDSMQPSAAKPTPKRVQLTAGQDGSCDPIRKLLAVIMESMESAHIKVPPCATPDHGMERLRRLMAECNMDLYLEGSSNKGRFIDQIEKDIVEDVTSGAAWRSPEKSLLDLLGNESAIRDLPMEDSRRIANLAFVCLEGNSAQDIDHARAMAYGCELIRLLGDRMRGLLDSATRDALCKTAVWAIWPHAQKKWEPSLGSNKDPSGYRRRAVTGGFNALLSLAQTGPNHDDVERECPVSDDLIKMILVSVSLVMQQTYALIDEAPDPMTVLGWRLVGQVVNPRLSWQGIGAATFPAEAEAEIEASVTCIETMVNRFHIIEFQRRAHRINVADPSFGFLEAEAMGKPHRLDYTEDNVKSRQGIILEVLKRNMKMWLTQRLSSGCEEESDAASTWEAHALAMLVACNCLIQKSTTDLNKLTLEKNSTTGLHHLDDAGVHDSTATIMFMVLGEGRTDTAFGDFGGDPNRVLPPEVPCRTIPQRKPRREVEQIALVGLNILARCAQHTDFVNAPSEPPPPPSTGGYKMAGQFFIWTKGLRVATQVLRVGRKYDLPKLQLEALRCIALLTADGGTKCIDERFEDDKDSFGTAKDRGNEARPLLHFDLMSTVDAILEMVKEEPEFWKRWKKQELYLAALRALSRVLRIDVCSERLHRDEGGLELIMDILSGCPDGAAQVYCLRGLCNALEIESPHAAAQSRERWRQRTRSGSAMAWQSLMKLVLAKMGSEHIQSDPALMHECCRLLSALCIQFKAAGNFLVKEGGIEIAVLLMKRHATKGKVMGSVIAMFAAMCAVPYIEEEKGDTQMESEKKMLEEQEAREAAEAATEAAAALTAKKDELLNELTACIDWKESTTTLKSLSKPSMSVRLGVAAFMCLTAPSGATSDRKKYPQHGNTAKELQKAWEWLQKEAKTSIERIAKELLARLEGGEVMMANIKLAHKFMQHKEAVKEEELATGLATGKKDPSKAMAYWCHGMIRYNELRLSKDAATVGPKPKVKLGQAVERLLSGHRESQAGGVCGHDSTIQRIKQAMEQFPDNARLQAAACSIIDCLFTPCPAENGSYVLLMCVFRLPPASSVKDYRYGASHNESCSVREADVSECFDIYPGFEAERDEFQNTFCAEFQQCQIDLTDGGAVVDKIAGCPRFIVDETKLERDEQGITIPFGASAPPRLRGCTLRLHWNYGPPGDNTAGVYAGQLRPVFEFTGKVDGQNAFRARGAAVQRRPDLKRIYGTYITEPAVEPKELEKMQAKLLNPALVQSATSSSGRVKLSQFANIQITQAPGGGGMLVTLPATGKSYPGRWILSVDEGDGADDTMRDEMQMTRRYQMYHMDKGAAPSSEPKRVMSQPEHQNDLLLPTAKPAQGGCNVWYRHSYIARLLIEDFDHGWSFHIGWDRDLIFATASAIAPPEEDSDESWQRLAAYPLKVHRASAAGGHMEVIGEDLAVQLTPLVCETLKQRLDFSTGEVAPDDDPLERIPCLRALSTLVRYSEVARQFAALDPSGRALQSTALLCRAHRTHFGVQLAGLTLLADLAEEISEKKTSIRMLVSPCNEKQKDCFPHYVVADAMEQDIFASDGSDSEARCRNAVLYWKSRKLPLLLQGARFLSELGNSALIASEKNKNPKSNELWYAQAVVEDVSPPEVAGTRTAFWNNLMTRTDPAALERALKSNAIMRGEYQSPVLRALSQMWGLMAADFDIGACRVAMMAFARVLRHINFSKPEFGPATNAVQRHLKHFRGVLKYSPDYDKDIPSNAYRFPSQVITQKLYSRAMAWEDVGVLFLLEELMLSGDRLESADVEKAAGPSSQAKLYGSGKNTGRR